MAIVATCTQAPGLGKFNGKTWGPYTAPSNFESFVLDYVSQGIIKNQKTGTKWFGYRMAAYGNICPAKDTRHPYTKTLYKQQMPGIQQVQYFLSGYSNSGATYTLQNTCNWLFLSPDRFSLTDWYSNVANYVNNWIGFYPGARLASSLYGAYSIFSGPATPKSDDQSPPTNNELADLIYAYVRLYWDRVFRQNIDPTFDKAASAAVDAENALCPSWVDPTEPKPPVIVTDSANPTNPPANNGSYVLDNRGNPIPSRNQSRPVPKPVGKPTPSRNQAVPVSKPPARPTPTRNQVVPVPPKVR